MLKSVYVFLERECVRVVSNGTIEKAVVSEKADFSTRRKSFMDVFDIVEKEEGAQGRYIGATLRGLGRGQKARHQKGLAEYVLVRRTLTS